MSERDELLKIDDVALKNTLWFNGPADFVVFTVVKLLRADRFWGPIFGVTDKDPKGYIDEYMREDYPERSLPALRVYNEAYDKQFDSWFVEGDLVLDLIFPASVRRENLQKIPDVVSSAMLQQFRRRPFFRTACEMIPGLNELGKRFSVDKTLGFKWGEGAVPLTQLRVNFKIDLRIWDDYLEQTNRTKDEPFEPTLGSLDRIVSEIQGLRDVTPESEEVTIEIDQSTKP